MADCGDLADEMGRLLPPRKRGFPVIANSNRDAAMRLLKMNMGSRATFGNKMAGTDGPWVAEQEMVKIASI